MTTWSWRQCHTGFMIYTHARKTALRNIPPVISSQSTHCAALIWFVEFTSLLSKIISYVLQQEIYGSERDFHSILAFWRSVKPFRLVNFHSTNSNQHANRAKQDNKNWKAWTIIARMYDTSDSTIAAFIYMELFTISDVLNFHYRAQFMEALSID